MTVSDRQFASSKHRYRDPRTGERPKYSVTGVVGGFAEPGKIDKLMWWAMRQGPGFDADRREAGKRGTRVHSHAADWAQGHAIDVLPGDEPYLDALQAFDNSKHPEWVAVERDVVSSEGYGGRFDAVAYFDGQFVLLDVKTSERAYRTELTLQLAGYRFADGMIRYSDKGDAVDLEPMPHVDACAGLYLSETGSWTLVYVEADKVAHAAFQALLAVRRWRDETVEDDEK